MKKSSRLFKPPDAEGHSPELTRYLGRWWIPGVTPGRTGGLRHDLKPTTPEEFRANQWVLAWALITSGLFALLVGVAGDGGTDWALLGSLSGFLVFGGVVILVRTRRTKR